MVRTARGPGARAGAVRVGGGRDRGAGGAVAVRGSSSCSSRCWWRRSGSLARPLGDAGAVLVVVVGGARCAGLADAAAPAACTRCTCRRLRRAWERAAVDAGLSDGPLRSPRVRGRSRGLPAGDELRVRVRRGQSVADLEARREQLAACLRVREVRVLRDREDAALAQRDARAARSVRGRRPAPLAGRRRGGSVAVGADPGRRR